jgi:oxygen-independent coproporphyrinogen-3 oxidase
MNVLRQEIVNNASEEAVESVYIGGGTPSFIDSIEIVKTMDGLKRHFNLAPDAEITIEANPGSIGERSLQNYLRSGINRISIGMQSGSDRLLKILGRTHSSEDFLCGFEASRAAGFKNISADLIFAIPGQTMREWSDSLKMLTDCGPEHISAYSLTIGEGTGYERSVRAGELQLLEEEEDREMYHFAVDLLRTKGFDRYEISNFARPGFESAHNLNYWNCGEYFGFGAGAHSYLSRHRKGNVAQPDEYIRRIGQNTAAVDSDEFIDDRMMISEYLFLGIRKTEGIIFRDFHAVFGFDFTDRYRGIIAKLENNGLVHADATSFRLSEKGFDLANQVMMEFV